jgi:hypothetical protein
MTESHAGCCTPRFDLSGACECVKDTKLFLLLPALWLAIGTVEEDCAMLEFKDWRLVDYA